MPFHFRLLGRDRYAMFSFIQSMNTTFGLSIWEQIAVILAENAKRSAKRQYILKGSIDPETESLIQDIVNKLRSGTIPTDKRKESETIKSSVKQGNASPDDPDRIVDFFLRYQNVEEYFDITSAKPNMKEFVALKTKLLRWTALRYSQGKDIQLHTALAIPYNPYHPKPYERWTLKGLYDLNLEEVMVGEQFWNHVADDQIYGELLDIFREIGEELRGQIDTKFSEFR